MGKIIDLNEKRKGVINEIVNIVDATNLELNIDFQIASIIVMDKEMDVHSLGGFLKTKSSTLFSRKAVNPIEIAKTNTKGKEVDVYSTPFPKSETIHLKFYELKSDINIDLATEIGLGVVKYNGKYHIYYPYMSNEPREIVMEMLMLKIYIQLLNPRNVDISLAKNFDKIEDEVMSRMIIDMPKHMNRLKEILGV